MVSNLWESNLSGSVVPGFIIKDVFNIEYTFVENFIYIGTGQTVTVVYNSFEDKFELKSLEWLRNTTTES